MEYHVPEKFTKARPAVHYTHEDLGYSFANHPRSENYLECEGTSRTFIQGPVIDPADETPRDLKDYLNSDHPLMGLKITSFSDATVVGITWPHFMMDIVGKAELLRAWSLVLAGKEDEVPPVLGATRDLAWDAGAPDAAAKEEEEEWLMLKNAVSAWGMARFLFGLVWGWLLGPKLTGRHFVMENSTINKLVKRARADINNEFVSEGDVLTAWVNKVANKAEGHKASHNVVQVLNLRYRVPAFLSGGGVIIANLLGQVYCYWSPEFLKNATIGELALSHREALKEQATEAQALGFLRCARQRVVEKRSAPFCIRPEAETYAITNWSKSDIFRMADFSPALIRAGDASPKRVNPPGSMVTADHRRRNQSLWFKGSTIVTGKDHAGNTWLWAYMTDQIWDVLDVELHKLDTLADTVDG